MIEVELPDGTIAEFPEGTPPETIKQALAKYRTKPAEPKGMLQTLKENVLGDDDPTTQNTGEKIGSALNKAGEAMTFGLIGDEADAAVAGAIPGGMGYDERLQHNRQQEAVLERDNPGLALGAEIGGGVAGALLPGGAIGTLARGASLPAKIVASGATGAGMGGLYGFMEGEGASDRMGAAKSGAALGGIVGGAAPVVGAGVQKIADSLKRSSAIRAAAQGAPSTDALRAQGNALYDQIDNAGVQIKPQAFDNARGRILELLRNNTGFDELPGPGSLTPNTARVSQIMDQASGKMAQDPTAALPFKSLDQMRRQAGAAAGNVANKTDQKAGVTVIEGLDDMVKGLGPDDVVAGDVKALQSALPKARDVWSRMSKSQVMDDAMEKADNYLSGGASGLRNQFKNILQNKKLAAQFSEAEKAAMRRVAKGSIPEQLLYTLAGGLGNLGAIGGGFALGGPLGAVGGIAASAGMRKAAESVAGKNAEIARALVANGKLQNLPVATDSARKIVESLMRRTGAAGAQ